MNDLLHPELINPLARYVLRRRIAEVRQQVVDKKDPDVSIVIRTKNDMAYMKTLFADIRAQEYNGKTEIILVDTESNDGTAEYAKSQGAKVLTIRQRDFTYPKALNMGFAASRYPYVVTIVGHSALSSRWFLRSLTRWYDVGKEFGGVYNGYLPNWNATRVERFIANTWAMGMVLKPGPRILSKPKFGMVGANGAIVSRAAWKQLGGFDERYAAGGEDGVLGQGMLAADMLVVQDPLCTPLHSHSLGLRDNFRQLQHWKQVAKPLPFSTEDVNSRRPDMRAK